jgi:hypothetical protein
VAALRAALVLERGDALCIGKGLPRQWLASGQPVRVTEAPTAFGRTSFELRYDREAHVLEGSVTVPENCDANQLRVYLRLPETMTPRDADLADGLRLELNQPIASGTRPCPVLILDRPRGTVRFSVSIEEAPIRSMSRL